MMTACRIWLTAIALGCAALASACAEPEAATGSQVLVSVNQPGGAQPNGTFLHLSDIHFDVFADGMAGRVANLPVSQWQAQFEQYASKTPSSGKADTNYALLKSALAEAKAQGRYDFILYTGDYLPHGFGYGNTVPAQAEMAAKVTEFVNLMIAQEFPGTPVVGALGNNDSGCGDYNLIPKGAYLADLAPEMPGLAGNASAQADFANGGYYTIPHPTVAGTDFVVLSSFWSHKYPENQPPCAPASGDPGQDQADWLGDALAPGSGSPPRKAILLMHIPPGIDGYSGTAQWHSRFEGDFEKLVRTSKRPVIGSYAGHSHMDEFRVLADAQGPYLGVRIAPSVTTWNGNAPAFTVARYSSSDGSMTDYSVFSRRPDQTGALSWQFEYSFAKAYGAADYSPATLAALARRITDNADTSGARAAYLRYYSAKDRATPPGNWKNAVCATSNSDPAAFSACTARVR